MSAHTFSSPNAVAGPSLPSSASRKTFYPQWPETHDDAEYHEIPPDHFLAQQRGLQKPTKTQSPPPAVGRRGSASSLDSYASAASSATQTQPLAELASAIQAGLPIFPSPTAAVVSPTTLATQRPLQDVIPTPIHFAETHEEMPDTSTLAAADFDVDVRSGFLPPEAPVTRLNGKHEELWEVALDQAKTIPLMQGGGGVRITSLQCLQARRWRRSIREMPVLPLSEEVSTDIRYARRGHLVLSFLAHFYIHSQPPAAPEAARPAPSWRGYFTRKSQQQLDDEQDIADELAGKFSRTLPAAIAVPWVQLSHKLALPPILTYATTVLWNWTYIDPAKGLMLDNIRMLESFTNTKSEEHFYLTSALIEIRGVEALELMRVSLDEAFVGDVLSRRRIAAYLNRLAVVIADLTQLLHGVRTDCDPKVFYWGIRPWFRGSDAAEGDEQPGWHFEGVDAPGVRRSFSGPSAGQSSIIHAIDVFLDVDHTRSKLRANRPAVSPDSAASESEAIRGDSRGADATFMERMQLYMPGHHRNFLTHLRSISFDDDDEDGDPDNNDEARRDSHAADPSGSTVSQGDDVADETEAQPVERPPPVFSHPIRSLALKAQQDGQEEGLPAAYDNALNALKTLRDGHMKVAYLYIIAQARGSPPDEYAPLPKGFTGVMGVEGGKLGFQPDDVLAAADNSQKGAKGTGGTDLVSFLKDCRVNTTDALISIGKKATAVAAAAISDAVTSVGTSASSGSNGEESSSATGQGSDGQSLDASSALSLERLSVTEEASGDNKADLASTSSSSAGGLQVWAVNVAEWEPEAVEFSSLVDQLLGGSDSADDRAKVRKYYRQIDRTRSLAARLLPRLMFAQLYGLEWEAMRFGATREGRPYLEAPPLPNATDFNISHDSDWVVLAFHAPATVPTATQQAPTAESAAIVSTPTVTADRATMLLDSKPVSPSTFRVGVDVMQIVLPRFEKDVQSFCETMDMAFTSDEQRWVLDALWASSESEPAAANEAEALSRLFDLWTHKEAFTKNIGKGLGFDFKTVEICFYQLREGTRSTRTTSTDESVETILKIKGTLEPGYTFTKIVLDGSGGSGSHSQVVVAEGPSEKREGRQIRPPIRQSQAVEQGLLKVWKMDELIEFAHDHARCAV